MWNVIPQFDKHDLINTGSQPKHRSEHAKSIAIIIFNFENHLNFTGNSFNLEPFQMNSQTEESYIY